MSILTDMLADYVVADGVSYPINTDFRVWLEFDRIINSRKIKTENKTERIFKLCFRQEESVMLPRTAISALSALYEFYLREKPHAGGKESAKRVFSFEEDADYIYVAFLTQYQIDLLSVPYLHWHVFLALLNGLEDNRRLMKMIALRGVNVAEISDKERRKYYQKLQELYALSDNRTEAEKENDAAEILFSVM